MAATIYYDNDADLSVLKDKTVAILGYGSQGHAHAQNLRDSGCKVVVGELEGTDNYKLAVEAGFQLPQAGVYVCSFGILCHPLICGLFYVFYSQNLILILVTIALYVAFYIWFRGNKQKVYDYLENNAAAYTAE